MSSSYGENLRIHIFGESHGPAVGVTVEGIPAGERVDLEELQRFLDRRAPGRSTWSTPRKEADIPEFLSGLREGRTCGTPLTAILKSANTRSGDYDALRDVPRPGHADYTAWVKYGESRDSRGGGHFSGRITAPLVAAGAICQQVLAAKGITIATHIRAAAGVEDLPFAADEPALLARQAAAVSAASPEQLALIDPAREESMRAAVRAAGAEGDSVGGILETAVLGLPAGAGEPFFDSAESVLSHLLFSIPAVKGVEFGDGFALADQKGSGANDPLAVQGGRVVTLTNHNGGINGGITNGMPLVFRAAFKPTPSIAQEQDTVNLETGQNATLSIHGRHDPCIVPRAAAAVEAAACVAVLELLAESGLL